jgi:hypothetical protein
MKAIVWGKEMMILSREESGDFTMMGSETMGLKMVEVVEFSIVGLDEAEVQM